ncbi:MAG: hypothetical protein HW398_965, partial [Acidobacteria bacterium]|nr:hypothetical protein [Acidobacteriota bacterium]
HSHHPASPPRSAATVNFAKTDLVRIGSSRPDLHTPSAVPTILN